MVWFERRLHQRLWPLETLFGSWRSVPEFPINRRKIPHPMPKFWWVPLLREQSNLKSRQDICRFPDSRTVFSSNPRSQKYATRPCSKVFAARMTKLITARARKNQTPDHGSHACKCSQRPFDAPPSVCSVRNVPTLWSLAATSSVGFRVLHYEFIDECTGRERPWRALA